MFDGRESCRVFAVILDFVLSAKHGFTFAGLLRQIGGASEHAVLTALLLQRYLLILLSAQFDDIGFLQQLRRVVRGLVCLLLGDIGAEGLADFRYGIFV